MSIVSAVYLLFLAMWCGWQAKASSSRGMEPPCTHAGAGLAEVSVEHRQMGSGLVAELVWARPLRVTAAGSGGAGEETEALAEPLIMVIPGFPGGAQIYADFLATLCHGAACPVVCVAWRGQHPGASPAGKHSLGDQVAFFATALTELRAAPTVGELVLVGHSLGSWLGSQALAAVEVRVAVPPAVGEVHLFCPCLEHFGAVPRARQLRTAIVVCRALRLDACAQALAAMLPIRVSGALLQWLWWLRGKTTLQPEERWFFETVAAHLGVGVISRALGYVAEAFAEVHAPGAWLEALRRRRAGVTLHYARDDCWTPEASRRRLASADRLPDAKRVFHVMPHGIITQHKAAREVAVSLAGDVRTTLQGRVANAAVS